MNLWYTKTVLGKVFIPYRKFLTPTGNFPATYDPNWKLKILTGHFPTSDNVNGNMSKFFFTTYQKQLAQDEVATYIEYILWSKYAIPPLVTSTST